jgi:RNA polymerase sigma-70 factor (ECF subfamily)
VKTDEQLVDAAQHGSNAAFDELVLRYREKLFRFLLTRCASHADAEDIIQDTFVNAYRYLGSYNSRWRFSTWLYRIAIRNAMRQPTSGRNAADESSEALAQESVHGSVNMYGPLDQCIASSERENMWLAAKEILAPDAYTAMWLHYVEDMPVKEVSRALDRSLSWTKVALFRGRRKLTQRLEIESATNVGSTSYG